MFGVPSSRKVVGWGGVGNHCLKPFASYHRLETQVGFQGRQCSHSEKPNLKKGPLGWQYAQHCSNCYGQHLGGDGFDSQQPLAPATLKNY